ncbi:MAG: NnrS family protein [Ectothiorhodospiraceae bacterium]|nr:NnrS family protein [Ectothiorhodospiraceae bacterium]MCH8506373.1 NnrS family protein [Ectothiorhodospiraceae bacterium]
MPDTTFNDRAAAGLWQLFAYPFRVFFLSLALLSVLVVPLWLAVLMGLLQLPLALPGFHWHQHELVFAFLQAGIAGFLLTAVCVWTGTERMHGARLLGLWLVWLAGRLLMAGGDGLPDWLVFGVNLAFLPLVMVDAGWRIWQTGQRRQLVIMLVLGLLWLMQLGFLLQPHGPYASGALIVAMALMLVIGGRITPNFSMAWLRQRGLSTEGILVVPLLEKMMLAAMALTFLAVMSEASLAVLVTSAAAGALTLVRLALWRGWRVRGEPLLWVLHLSLLWIPVGLWLLAGSAAGWWVGTVWMHAVGVGAMGGLMLGVISRVALGHTGRPLVLPAGMVTAFVLIQLAALARVGAALGWLPWHAGIGAGTLLWTAAYALFLLRYTLILAAPRVDGRPG